MGHQHAQRCQEYKLGCTPDFSLRAGASPVTSFTTNPPRTAQSPCEQIHCHLLCDYWQHHPGIPEVVV